MADQVLKKSIRIGVLIYFAVYIITILILFLNSAIKEQTTLMHEHKTAATSERFVCADWDKYHNCTIFQLIRQETLFFLILVTGAQFLAIAFFSHSLMNDGLILPILVVLILNLIALTIITTPCYFYYLRKISLKNKKSET